MNNLSIMRKKRECMEIWQEETIIYPHEKEVQNIAVFICSMFAIGALHFISDSYLPF